MRDQICVGARDGIEQQKFKHVYIVEIIQPMLKVSRFKSLTMSVVNAHIMPPPLSLNIAV